MSVPAAWRWSCEELQKLTPDRTARAVKRAARQATVPRQQVRAFSAVQRLNQVRGDRVTGLRFAGEMTPDGGEDRRTISADRARRLKSPAEAAQIRANLVPAAVSRQQIDH